MIIVQRLFRHISGKVPEFQCDEDAINQLQELMTQIGSNPILLILDDVWSGSEFRLEKLKLNVPNFNILVTSRTTFPGFSFTHNLKPLNDEDATTLLRHFASLQDGSSHIPDKVIEKVLCQSVIIYIYIYICGCLILFIIFSIGKVLMCMHMNEKINSSFGPAYYMPKSRFHTYS